ncbi:MAG: HAD family phosphatase [Muribaculaceae bacterium]|nr:HAD family phosphatase [Muribaculaceae bacterium]
MLTNYDNVVFDLGGVILDINRDKCVEALEALGFSEADKMLDLYVQTGIFLALEDGSASAAEFYDELRKQCTKPGVSDADISEALSRFITGLPVARLQALRELRAQGKRIFSLSNTNPVMYPTRIAELFRAEGLQIDDYFDGQILSFREQVCKPAPGIFQRLLTRYKLDPARTLFLDDSAKNCEAAEEQGIISVLIPEGAEFMDILSFVD